MMHYWGDEWFQKYGKDLDDAINWIDCELNKKLIYTYPKEKYGTMRETLVHFWDGGLYWLLFPGRLYTGPVETSKWKWINKLKESFHNYIHLRIDEGYTWKMIFTKDLEKQHKLIEKHYISKDGKWIEHGLKGLMSRIGILKIVWDKQADWYNKTFQEACKKWPDIIDELIVDLDGYKMIKPGKYGNISGEDIHKKYWKPLNNSKDEQDNEN